jgi:outer membrane protein OmpA-like peptidoglycan-associated protein
MSFHSSTHDVSQRSFRAYPSARHQLPGRHWARPAERAWSARRIAADRARAGRLAPGRPARSWLPVALIAGVLIASAAAAAAVQMARAHAQACGAHGQLIVGQQVTAEEGASLSPPPGLLSQADRLAACGGGQLIMIRGAGQGGVQAGPDVPLRVYREPGQLENDPIVRQAKVAALVQSAFRNAQHTRVAGAGRDVLGLLGAISSKLGSGQNTVWLETLGLPTVSPANALILMAADPAQAAESIARWVPSLRGARIHLVLSPPAGKQPPLNIATDAWRRYFMLDILREAQARVVSVTEIETLEAPAPGSPPAPVIPNLPEQTPRPAGYRPGTPYTATLDSSTLFIPNSTQFLSSPTQVVAQLEPIITGWQRGYFARVVVVGHCARFGSPEGALLLSSQRATEIARLLREHGVTDVTAQGVGYEQPLPPSPESASNRVVVVTAYPKN